MPTSMSLSVYVLCVLVNIDQIVRRTIEPINLSLHKHTHTHIYTCRIEWCDGKKEAKNISKRETQLAEHISLN